MDNLSVAQAAKLQRIEAIAERAQLSDDDFEPLGRTKAKLTHEGIARLRTKPQGKLILVTAMSPTPHGEGKTTMAVGLAQGLNRIGRSAIPALREPALGPIFGIKGGAAGGGYSQVLPMEDINLFFTGDFPALAAAHNLLSALLDAHLNHGNALQIDWTRPGWPRTIDMNDRALRQVMVGLGGSSNGIPRETGYVIVPASELMAVLCLSRDLAELKQRLGRILVGVNQSNAPVQAESLQAVGAMAVLLRDALRPNLVQTLEGGPALVHGGPFGNIAHGCSSIIGTECALGLCEFTVTEAGFGADLGAEKFMSLVAPRLGRGPDAIALVVTRRALEHHGDGDWRVGLGNVGRHLEHLQRYGVPIVASLNLRAGDTTEVATEIASVLQAEFGVEAVVADPYGSGGAGCEALANAVSAAADRTAPGPRPTLYQPEDTLIEKLEKVVRGAYGGVGVHLSDLASKQAKWLSKHGLGNLPVCIAKTQYSFSDDPKRLNAPAGFEITIQELRPSLGAGFVVAVAGEIMLMPGLGRDPAAFRMDVDAEGRISGLF